MTKTAKLYAWVVANPRSSISFRDFERLLIACGFACERIWGSHKAYRHPGVDRLMVVQPRGKDAKPYQVQQFLYMVEEFDLKLDDQ